MSGVDRRGPPSAHRRASGGGRRESPATIEVGRASSAAASTVHRVLVVHRVDRRGPPRGRRARGQEALEGRTLAASDFFREVLATFEMTRRGFVEGLAPPDEEAAGRPGG